jgi:hypothetical protein
MRRRGRLTADDRRKEIGGVVLSRRHFLGRTLQPFPLFFRKSLVADVGVADIEAWSNEWILY